MSNAVKVSVAVRIILALVLLFVGIFSAVEVGGILRVLPLVFLSVFLAVFLHVWLEIFVYWISPGSAISDEQLAANRYLTLNAIQTLIGWMIVVSGIMITLIIRSNGSLLGYVSLAPLGSSIPFGIISYSLFAAGMNASDINTNPQGPNTVRAVNYGFGLAIAHIALISFFLGIALVVGGLFQSLKDVN